MRWLPVSSERKRRRRRKASRKSRGTANMYHGYGHLVNPAVGIGTSADKVGQGTFTRVNHSERDVEYYFNESWAVKRAIRLPISDMLIKWRRWDASADPELVKDIGKLEKRLSVPHRMAKLLETAAIYGTAIGFIATEESQADVPLVSTRVREADYRGIRIFSRYDGIAPIDEEYAIYSPNYGKPTLYRMRNQKTQENFDMHYSRVLRVDYNKCPRDRGWFAYDSRWGISQCQTIVRPAIEEALSRSGSTSMILTTNMPVVGVPDLGEVQAGGMNKEAAQQMVDHLTRYMGSHRVLMIDSEAKIERLAANFGGIGQLLDYQAFILAAAAGIPATRFFGRSPAGMNATGEADKNNYSLDVRNLQNELLTPVMMQFDMVMASMLGVAELPEWDWEPLDESDLKRAETSTKTVEAVAKAIAAGTMTEEEGRATLSGVGIFGHLDPDDIMGELISNVPDPNDANDGSQGDQTQTG